MVLKQVQKDGTVILTGAPINSFADIKQNIVDLIYPVGSLYLSVTNVNPQIALGGTWVVFGTGRTLVAVDTAQTEFATVQQTGGEKTHILTAGEMPAHTHTINHDHPQLTSASSNGMVDHSHTINHDHAAFTTASGGTHDHNVNRSTSEGDSGINLQSAGVGAASAAEIVGTGAHTHTIDVPAFTGSSGTIGAGLGAHTHTVDVPSFTGASGSAGSGTAHNNLQPYITCYMWRRTA